MLLLQSFRIVFNSRMTFRQQNKIFIVAVVASEDGKQSKVPLEAIVTDVNDNAPIFTQPIYTATTREDVTAGETILTGRNILYRSSVWHIYDVISTCRFTMIMWSSNYH